MGPPWRLPSPNTWTTPTLCAPYAMPASKVRSVTANLCLLPPPPPLHPSQSPSFQKGSPPLGFHACNVLGSQGQSIARLLCGVDSFSCLLLNLLPPFQPLYATPLPLGAPSTHPTFLFLPMYICLSASRFCISARVLLAVVAARDGSQTLPRSASSLVQVVLRAHLTWFVSSVVLA